MQLEVIDLQMNTTRLNFRMIKGNRTDPENLQGACGSYINFSK